MNFGIHYDTIEQMYDGHLLNGDFGEALQMCKENSVIIWRGSTYQHFPAPYGFWPPHACIYYFILTKLAKLYTFRIVRILEHFMLCDHLFRLLKHEINLSNIDQIYCI